MAKVQAQEPHQGIEVSMSGKVQGVGFRPLVYRLAKKQHLDGFVLNRDSGVAIYLLGDENQARDLCHQIQQASANIATIEQVRIAATQFHARPVGFKIRPSELHNPQGLPPADIAMCPDCLAELSDPTSRYYRYPFLSCTHCGPRFSIVDQLPFDRSRTSMGLFALCPTCNQAYQNVDDRRFHAQTISCFHCGPDMWLYDRQGSSFRGPVEFLLLQCHQWLDSGRILAVKGVGGFKLCCDATDAGVIETLRCRKRRPNKPLAVMMQDLAQAEEYFELSNLDRQLLASPQAPIVLLNKKQLRKALPDALAPLQGYIGIMLANSPLMWLLLNAAQRPLVVTSGNANGAPICINHQQALDMLGNLADAFVLHDRDIRHRVDDSVVQVIGGTARMVRRARGYVPSSISLPKIFGDSGNVLAMGADLKNCFCLSKADKAVLSAHHGDLSNPASLQTWKDSIQELIKLLGGKPEVIAIDAHPEYQSAKWGKQLAQDFDVPCVPVQHHHAHMVSCLVEHGVHPAKQTLGIVLDGLGYGSDNSIWGGEFLLGNYKDVKRVAHLKPVSLLGNDQANIQPWRNLLSQLAEASDNWPDWVDDLPIASRLMSTDAQALLKARGRFVNSSSMGRLFDAVAALLTDCPDTLTFEGQGAMALEALAIQHQDPVDSVYPLL